MNDDHNLATQSSHTATLAAGWLHLPSNKTCFFFFVAKLERNPPRLSSSLPRIMNTRNPGNHTNTRQDEKEPVPELYMNHTHIRPHQHTQSWILCMLIRYMFSIESSNSRNRVCNFATQIVRRCWCLLLFRALCEAPHSIQPLPPIRGLLFFCVSPSPVPTPSVVCESATTTINISVWLQNGLVVCLIAHILESAHTLILILRVCVVYMHSYKNMLCFCSQHKFNINICTRHTLYTERDAGFVCSACYVKTYVEFVILFSN